MKRSIGVILVILMALFFIGCASTAQKAMERTIIVTGKGTVEVKPDMASFTVMVKQTKDTTSEAQKATNEKVAQVMEILKGHGIKEDDISTENLSLYTEYKWENNKQTRVGESCSQTLAVKLRDLPKLGEVIDQLGKVDAISLDSIRFDKADKNGDYAEARRKAAADAREKATVYASSFNMVLGTPLTITEGTSYSQPVYRNAKVAATMASASDMEFSTDAPSGMLTIQATVSVVFDAR